MHQQCYELEQGSRLGETRHQGAASTAGWGAVLELCWSSFSELLMSMVVRVFLVHGGRTLRASVLVFAKNRTFDRF